MSDRRPHLWERWSTVLLAAGGGVIGATARAAIGDAVGAGSDMPWGTLTANVVGSFALGALVAVLGRVRPRPFVYVLVGVGFLGSLTTMSSFQVEAVLLVADGRPMLAVVYVVSTLALGLGAAWAGLRVAGGWWRVAPR